MKWCPCCERKLDESLFLKNRSKSDGIGSICRTCSNAVNRSYLERKREQIDRLKDRPCSDCGGKFPPVCMDFDHRDRLTKTENVSKLVSRRYELILQEIEKCDLVCANCHRIRTQSRLDHIPIPESSSGKTPASEAVNHGSNPCPGSQMSLQLTVH